MFSIVANVVARALLWLCAAIISSIILIHLCILRPPVEPRGIPAVPFWVPLLALFKDVDQEDLFKRYTRTPLLKHGAVKIFFAGQWNVLVARPALLAQIFKEVDHFQKSGNHKKIPGSVLASYLGENIISAHGETWRTFRGIMQPGLQEGWQADAIFANAKVICQQLSAASIRDVAGAKASVAVSVREYIQRYTIANLAEVILGVDFGTMTSETAFITQIQSSIKRQIFQPIFMSFPFLDKLGLQSREKARKAAHSFTDYLVDMVAKQHDLDAHEFTNGGVSPSHSTGSLNRRLFDAWRSETITEQQLRDNLTISFVAGQENPELALISTLYLLAKNPKYQDLIYQECRFMDEDKCDVDDLQKLPQLTSVILESLRLLPPIGQLVNRRAAKALILGQDICIPEGTYLGYNSYATNRDPYVWGIDADDFIPPRWGNTTESIQREFRRRKAQAEFISFHGGRRACLGEKFAMVQLKITLFIVTRRLRWTLDPVWPDRMTPAGPLSPRGLRLVFEERHNDPSANLHKPL